MTWSAGDLWSGGKYGPEASVLTLGVLALLFLYIRSVRVGRQTSPLIDPPSEGAVCETSQPLPS